MTKMQREKEIKTYYKTKNKKLFERTSLLIFIMLIIQQQQQKKMKIKKGKKDSLYLRCLNYIFHIRRLL